MNKNKILPFLVSFWLSFSGANPSAPLKSLLSEAQDLEKRSGPQSSVDYLWKNSEKLQRPELLYLAKSLVKLGNFKDLLRVSELGLSKNPSDSEFLTFQGKAYLETSKDRKVLDKAQESLRSAIGVDPKFEPPYLILDKYYEEQDLLSREQKKPARFLQSRRVLFEDLIAQRGETALYLSKMCEIDALDGVNGQAIKNCNRAIELNKSDVQSMIFLAKVHRQQGEPKEAVKAFLLAVKTSPKSEVVLSAYGSYLEEDKNFSEAYIQFKSCLANNPKSNSCLRGLGSSAASLKKWDESYKSFQKLCKKDRKWSLDVRKASMTAKELGEFNWEQKFLELSINCNI